MGTKEPDKCIFCGTELERWYYEYFEENGERGIEDMDICKDCKNKLKKGLK